MKSLVVVQKFCKVAYIIAKVLMILLFVGAGIIFSSALMMFGLSAVEAFNQILTESLVDFEFDFNAYQLGMLMIATSVITFANGIVFMYIKKYFKNELTEGTPFTHRGADELKFLGIRVVVWPLVASIVASVICSIANIVEEFDVSVDIGLGIALIFLSFVFHYGAELKEKADSLEKNEEIENEEIKVDTPDEF